MTNKLIHALAAITMLAASLNASAAEQYQVAVNLLHKGKSFATPSARVMNATPASFSVAGADGFELTFTVTDLGDNKLQIASKLDSKYGAMAATQLTVQAGKLASITLHDIELRFLVEAPASIAR